MNPEVDLYFAQGCGRCPLGGTPQCKVHFWPQEMQLLRMLLLESGLKEEVKWGVPCYTLGKANVIILAALKESCTLSFFKGALLKDPHALLEKPGENSQAGRMIRFTSPARVRELEFIVAEYIQEAIEVEQQGLKVPSQKVSDLELPQELLDKFEEDPSFKAAFEALSPGRQRGYLLHFSQAKQSKTKANRIEASIPRIRMGKGMGEY